MDSDTQKKLDEVDEHWRSRIVQEFDQMAGIIVELRELATHGIPPKLEEMVDRLHNTYCKMANTVQLRVALNGVAVELACEQRKHDDGESGE